jgi:hypothetical protein
VNDALHRADKGRLALWFLICVDAFLLCSIVYLSFGQQRLSFGRATGLVTTCAKGVGPGMRDAWSPLLLPIVGVPAVLTVVVAWRQRTGATLGTILATTVTSLVLVSLVVVLVPLGGTCIT